ncbi:CueP family metal-binding protein [Timonella sp. A28]|uniref:CueP family metal-binding protein n=1 Tax=Timonella sp. A28 TaxID=3442640 RepID=UPI003EBF9FD2
MFISRTVQPKNRRRVASIVALACVGVLTLTACSTDTDSSKDATTVQSSQASSDAKAQEILAAHDLSGKSAKEVIAALDAQAVADRPSDLRASIRPTGLLLIDQDNGEATLPMPDDEFYLSIAPYVSQTHECHFHSLTTCRGELGNKDITLTIVDDATGKTLVEQTTQTFDNGFVGVWLPRDIDATVTVESEGKSATTQISTHGDEDATCLTTMKLA